MSSATTLIWSARQMWADAPRWRWTVIAAALCSVGYLLSMANSPTVPPPPANQQQPVPQPVPPPPQPSPVRPIPPQEIDAGERLAAFFKSTEVTPQTKGGRCEVLVAALDRLRPGDAQFAKPAQRSRLAEADACKAPLQASDGRVKAFASDLVAYRQRPTASGARRVVEASRTLDDFDTSRSPAALGGTPKDLADVQSALSKYDGIVARVASTAPLFRKGDPASLDAAVVLAGLAPEIGSLPFAASLRDRASPEAINLAPVWEAQTELAEADRRISVVQTAFGRANVDPKGLAQALSALSPFDRARATASGVDLAAAQTAAKSVLPTVFRPIVERYQQVSMRTRDDAETLVGLARMSDELGAALDQPTSAMVSAAKADIAGSKERLRRLGETAVSWRQQRGLGTRNPDIDRQVRETMQLLTSGTGQLYPFDAGGTDAADRAAFETLRQATTEIEARLAPGFPRKSLRVSVDVAAGAGGQYGPQLRAALSSEIGQVFTSIANPAEAMLVVVVTDVAIRQVGSGVNARAGIGVELKGRLTWQHSGASIDLGSASGQASDSDPARAMNEALGLASAQLVRSADSKL